MVYYFNIFIRFPGYSIRLLIISMFLFAKIELPAQTIVKSAISGRITDSATGMPLPNVNVFLANTTRGAATDADGFYSITGISPGYYELIASMIGYELEIMPMQFSEPASIKRNIKLRPRVLSGEAVEIIAPAPKEWKNNLKRFQREFIGETENAKECRILNPEVLDFEVDESAAKFIAATDSTIIVENKSLGYKIYIILHTFRLHKDSLIYAIYPRFEELASHDSKEIENWKRTRQETYRGSFRHFISALARGTFSDEYFEIFTIGGYPIPPDELNIIPGRSTFQKWFYLDIPIMVVYQGLSKSGKGRFSWEHGTHFPASYIFLRHGYADIDTLGNVLSKFAIIHWGNWYRARIADMLPYEYSPKAEIKE